MIFLHIYVADVVIIFKRIRQKNKTKLFYDNMSQFVIVFIDVSLVFDSFF